MAYSLFARLMMGFGAVGVVVYVVGFPLVIGLILLHINRQKGFEDSKMLSKYACLSSHAGMCIPPARIHAALQVSVAKRNAQRDFDKYQVWLFVR